MREKCGLRLGRDGESMTVDTGTGDQFTLEVKERETFFGGTQYQKH